MTFNWRKFQQIAEFVAPLVLGVSGVPANVTALVVHSITLAQQIGDRKKLSGAEKKALAMDAVATGLAAVNTAKPGAVNVDELTAVVSDGIDLTIAAIHAAQKMPLPPPAT